jgi:hypothetical protein
MFNAISSQLPLTACFALTRWPHGGTQSQRPDIAKAVGTSRSLARQCDNAPSRDLLGADEEAVSRLRRSIEINRTFPQAHFFLAAALANLGKLDEARAETRVGLTLDSTFTIQRFRGLGSDNPIFLAGKERIIEGMRKAGVPNG